MENPRYSGTLQIDPRAWELFLRIEFPEFGGDPAYAGELLSSMVRGIEWVAQVMVGAGLRATYPLIDITKWGSGFGVRGGRFNGGGRWSRANGISRPVLEASVLALESLSAWDSSVRQQAEADFGVRIVGPERMFQIGVEEGHHACILAVAWAGGLSPLPVWSLVAYDAQDIEYMTFPCRVDAARVRGQEELASYLEGRFRAATVRRSTVGAPGQSVRLPRGEFARYMAPSPVLAIRGWTLV